MDLDEIISNIDISAIPTYVWIILLIVGLLLCFFGEIIWEFMVAILGAIVGSMIGGVIGYAYQGYICAIALSLIGALIGSMIFQILAKSAVALLLGFLAFGAAAYLAYKSNLTPETSLVIGIVVGVIIFVIAHMFVEEIISVFLAAIGGFLIGVGVYFLVGGDLAIMYAALAGVAMFILGSVFQVMMQRQRKGPRRPAGKKPVREAKPAEQSTSISEPTEF